MTIRIASAFKILSRRRRRGGYPAVPSSRRRAIGCSKPRFIDDGLPLSGGAAARPCPGRPAYRFRRGESLRGSGDQPRGKTMPVRIYHNPRCSTSRKTLAPFRDKGVEPEIVEYLNTPYTAAQLKTLLGQLKMPARALIRKKEAAE